MPELLGLANLSVALSWEVQEPQEIVLSGNVSGYHFGKISAPPALAKLASQEVVRVPSDLSHDSFAERVFVEKTSPACFCLIVFVVCFVCLVCHVCVLLLLFLTIFEEPIRMCKKMTVTSSIVFLFYT